VEVNEAEGPFSIINLANSFIPEDKTIAISESNQEGISILESIIDSRSLPRTNFKNMDDIRKE